MKYGGWKIQFNGYNFFVYERIDLISIANCTFSSELFNIYMNHIFSVTEKQTNSCVSSFSKLSTWFQVLKYPVFGVLCLTPLL